MVGAVTPQAKEANLEISVTCTNCNYHSRVSAATAASNMYYCQNCGKQITVALPRPNQDSGGRPTGRRPSNRRSTNRGPSRPGPKRR